MVEQPDVTHTLISIEVAPACWLHGYVMAPKAHERAQVHIVVEQMVDRFEKHIGRSLGPTIALSSRLDEDGIATVREVLTGLPNISASLAQATTYHHTCWAMSPNHPDHPVLMELHD